jgi:L-asparaginase/Glu-tRNA(Gln) amidotransferase subunit D
MYTSHVNPIRLGLRLVLLVVLARRINEVFQQDRDLAGIVVTSGTDTLEETAYFLNLTVRDARPVVVVGSMRNPSTLGYEGAANLLEGFRVAGEPEAPGKGVLVVTSTRTGSGRIAAEDLAPVKARILLMLALAQTRDPAEIQRMFTQY